MRKTTIIDIISALFILLFIYASVSKFIDFDKFQIQLGQSPLLTSFAEVVAWTIPVIEIFISLLLVFDKTRLLGLYGAFSLMTLFSFYIIAITKYSYFIPCSCGGILQHMSWNQHLAFNIVFIILSATGIFLDNKSSFFIAIKAGDTENLEKSRSFFQ
jgi:uncharacterized membrane protein YphA (DoxX/SURF4 family)